MIIPEIQVKRRFRLRRSADIKRVRYSGKSYAHPLVVLIVMASDEAQSRMGITAGQSIGGAVQRNRAKRLLRAAVQPLVGRILPGMNVVLVARKPIINASSTQVQEALTNLLGRASLISQKDD